MLGRRKSFEAAPATDIAERLEARAALPSKKQHRKEIDYARWNNRSNARGYDFSPNIVEFTDLNEFLTSKIDWNPRHNLIGNK